MKDILGRLYRIGVAQMPRPAWLKKVLKHPEDDGEFRYSEFFEKFTGGGFAGAGGADGESSENPFPGTPRQVVEDLAVFSLTPPSSLDEVRRIRNREIKKYHSDRFVNDPDRYQTSKEIMQIINAAYDRLEVYFDSGEAA